MESFDSTETPRLPRVEVYRWKSVESTKINCRGVPAGCRRGYDSFGGYIPTSTSTTTTTKYVLETIAYNLAESGDNQIVAVVTTNLDNPKDAAKTAKKYVDEIMKSLQ